MTLNSALAEAVVLIRADGSHLQNDIGTHADKAGTAAGERMGRSLSKSFRRLVGSALVLEGAKSALEFADAFEKSRSRLETITKNIGGDFEGLQGRVSSLDDKLAQFGFTNADVEGSLASLETATKNPTKAMTDLGLAADIARGRNISLEESTRILMRVETGHVAMLSKLGIQTKDANGKLLTQKEALEALAKVYGGSASHYADTFAGKQAALGAEIKNSAAEIGVALLPAAVDLAKVVQEDVLPPVIAMAHFLDRNRAVIEPLAKVILVGAAAWKTYTIAAKIAAAANVTFGRSAVATTEKTVALAAAEKVAGSSAAVAAEETTALTATERAAGGVLGRGRFSRVGFGAGGAALLAGQFVPGRTGGILTGAGTGALFGSAIGPEGAAIGAVIGGGAAAINSTATTQDYQNKFTKQAMSGPSGFAAVQATLNRDNASLSHGASFTGAGSVKIERDLAAAAIAAANATDKEKVAAAQAAASVGSENKQVRALTASMAVHANRVLATVGTYDSFRQLLNDLPGVVKQNGHALQGYSDKAIANRQALSQAAQAIFAHIDAMKAQHKSAGVVDAALLGMEKRLRAQATATYGSRNAVDAFLRKLGLLPAQVQKSLAGLKIQGLIAGGQLGAGLVAGMQAQQHAVTTEAKVIADQAVKGIRLGIDPGSPSKKTTKLGQQTGDGLVLGMKQRETAVKKQAQATAQAAIDGIKSKQSAVQQAAQSLAQSITQNITGNAALTNSPNQTAGGVEAFLRHQLSIDRAFRRNLKVLASKGYDRRLIGELAQEGPEAAGNLARQLAHATPRQRARINRLERGIRGTAAATGRQGRQEVFSPQLDKLAQQVHHLTDTVKTLGAEVKGAQHKGTVRTQQPRSR